MTPPRLWRESLASIAMNAWALRRKMLQLGPTAEGNSLMIHVNALHDALQQIAVEIQDHTGQPYRPGLSAEVLVFQPQADVTQDTITATIRPTVYCQGQIIRRGQVVVSTPEREQEQ